MKIALFAFLGFLLGAIAGGAIGVVAGLICINVFQTSAFEGYAGMLVFFTFMPIGMIVGALAGAIGLGVLAYRSASGEVG